MHGGEDATLGSADGELHEFRDRKRPGVLEPHDFPLVERREGRGRVRNDDVGWRTAEKDNSNRVMLAFVGT